MLKKRGDCPAHLLGYSLDCNPTPQDNHHSKAYPNRIKTYQKVFEQNSDASDKIDALLDELNKYKPVIIGLGVPIDFRTNIPAPYTQWASDGGHGMLVVGYNDYKKTFIIMNSYGTSWGDNGFFEMDYDTLGEQAWYGYVISLD